MKKYFLLIAAAAATVLAASCNKEKEVATSPSAKTSVIDDSVTMPVVFTSQYALTKAPVVETKGIGAVDDWQGDAQKLYLYGYEVTRTGKGVSYSETLKLDKALFENVSADAPTADSDDAGVRLDGSSRSKINLYNPAAAGGQEAQEPFYYYDTDADGNLVTFSFFGYYVDDAVAVPVPAKNVEAGTVVLSNLALDGTRDIMLATTDKEADALTSNRYRDKNTFGTSELNDDALAEYVDPTRIYSAHASRRGINPNLVFEHQLSRFTFYIRRGGSVPGNMIEIAGISIKDYTAGNLTIIGGENGTEGRGFVPTGDLVADAVQLRDNDGNVISGHSDIHPSDDYEKLGKSVLVVPGRNEYEMVLGIFQTGVTAPNFNPYNSTIKIQIPEDENGAVVNAEAGKNYNVYLTVYGLEEVRVSVTVTKWEDADIFIDPDKDELDLREAATIALGTDAVYPLGTYEGEQLSKIGDDAAKHYETQAEAEAYVDPYHDLPVAQLTIRICDTFDLLAEKQWNPVAEEYEDCKAFVRSNATGANGNVFHFTGDNDAVFTVTDKGFIQPVTVGEGTITVRQNSSNDYLAAAPRTIKVKVVEDNRIPVTVNWDNIADLVVINEEGAENTVDFLGSFTIEGQFNKTYFANYHEKNTAAGYSKDGWYVDRQLKDGSVAISGPEAEVETVTGDVPYAFALKFSVVEGYEQYVEVDENTGIINAVKATDPADPAQILVKFDNLRGSNWYKPTDKIITVSIVKREIVVEGVEDAYTVAYGESFTIQPKVTPGANAPVFSVDDESIATVNAHSGVVTGLKPGSVANVTVTIAESQFVKGYTKTVPVTVVKATPKIVAGAKMLNLNGNPNPASTALDIKVVNKAGVDISGEVGAITYTSDDPSVFTVDGSGTVTAVALGTSKVIITVAANDLYEAVTAEVSILVRP